VSKSTLSLRDKHGVHSSLKSFSEIWMTLLMSCQ
jgi:hypothetical protein